MAVEGVPSSESRWISLRATSSPVWRLRPLKTWTGQRERQPEEAVSLAVATYRSIGSLSELFKLLERAGVSSVVHGGHEG